MKNLIPAKTQLTTLSANITDASLSIEAALGTKTPEERLEMLRAFRTAIHLYTREAIAELTHEMEKGAKERAEREDGQALKIGRHGRVRRVAPYVMEEIQEGFLPDVEFP